MNNLGGESTVQGNKVIKSMKRERKHMIIFVVLMTLILSAYIIAKKSITERVDLRHILEVDLSYAFQVEETDMRKDVLELQGWIYKVDSDIKNFDWNIYLYDISNNHIIYPDKLDKIDKQDDVNLYFQGVYDYSVFAYNVFFKMNREKTTTNYEVLIADQNNSAIYKTGKYIVDGVLTESCLDVKPIIQGTNQQLDELIKQCSVISYDQQVGIYTLRSGNKIYWIWEKEKADMLEDSYVNLVHLFTVQKERLPIESQDAGFCNLDFSFHQREISYYASDYYRVAMLELPTEYPIYGVRIGQYDTDTLYWQRNIYWN